jgi:3-oxoacyl-[acyl-carrier protein] reductase
MKSTTHRVAIVTGSGRRLGRRIALALAGNGFDLVVNYLHSATGARQTVDLIHKMGRKAIAVRADVAKKADAQQLIHKTISQFGRLDLLVNNAAIFIESPWNETTEQIWDRTVDTNLKGTFFCCQSAASYMITKKHGRIINIASLGGIQAWKEHLPYSISKAGVIMLTRCLAKALAPLIAVNAIAPGTIIIDGEESPDQLHIPIDKIPLKHYGKPADITDLVLFLATTANYITGQTFVVDGGRSVQ